MKNNIKLIKRIFSNYDKNKEIIERYMLGDIVAHESSETYIKIKENDFKRASREVELRNLLFLQLNEDEKFLLNLRYDKDTNVNQAADKMYISSRQFYRKQKAIMNKLDRYIEEFKEIFEIK